MSIPEFAKTTPVTPPTVNKKIKPKANNPGVLKSMAVSYTHLTLPTICSV